jgi:hypothetical protein
MDRKRFKNTKREKIHLAMKLKSAIKRDWLIGTWDKLVIHSQELQQIQRGLKWY